MRHWRRYIVENLRSNLRKTPTLLNFDQATLQLLKSCFIPVGIQQTDYLTDFRYKTRSEDKVIQETKI